MATITINGEILDLPDDASVQTVLNSSLYFGGDVSRIEGNYSLPFSIQLSPKNRRLLHNPDILDSAEIALIAEPCTITIGDQVRSGTIGIQRVEGTTIKVFVIIDDLTALSTTKLTDLDLGGFRNIDPTIAEALLDDMPQADYCLIPMAGLPEKFVDEGIPDFQASINTYVNGYDVNAPVSPNIRVGYILERIADAIQFKLVDNWLVTDELKALMVSVNKVVFQADDSVTDVPDFLWPESINLLDFMPDMSCAEFVKRLRIGFNLGYSYDSSSHTLILSPTKNAINSTAHDWSKYATVRLGVEFNSAVPRQFSYASSTSRYNFTDRYDTTVPVRLTGPAALRSYTSEYTLIEAENIVMRSRLRSFPGTNTPSYWLTFEELHYRPAVLVGTDQDAPVEMPLVPLTDVRGIVYQGGDYNHEEVTFENTTTNKDIVIDASDTELSFRMCFYRGRHDWNFQGIAYPNTPTGSIGDLKQDATRYTFKTVDVDHSLELHGDRGVFASWHRKWWRFIANRKIVNVRFTLPLSVFSLYDELSKIQMGNREFFAKDLKVRTANNERVVIDATLILCL